MNIVLDANPRVLVSWLTGICNVSVRRLFINIAVIRHMVVAVAVIQQIQLGRKFNECFITNQTLFIWKPNVSEIYLRSYNVELETQYVLVVFILLSLIRLEIELVRDMVM